MSKKVVSVDFGGTNIRAALATTDGTLLNVVRQPTQAESGIEAVTGRIEEAIRRAAGDSWADVTGIGMIAPGPIDPWSGTVIFAPNLPGWKHVPLKDIFEESLDRPVAIGNDANLAALAEHQFGAGKGLHHLVYLTVSTGVGSGFIVNNKLLLGAKGYAAEAGQLVLDMNGPRHTSGVKGSIEGMAAGPAIAARARAQISGTVGQKLVELAGSVENISAFHVGQAAQQGDPLGVKLIEEAGTMVGFAVVNIMSLFNPEIVIIGGGVSSVGNLFFDPIKAVVRDNLHEAYWGDCPIVPVTLGDDVGLLGGVALLNSLDESH